MPLVGKYVLDLTHEKGTHEGSAQLFDSAAEVAMRGLLLPFRFQRCCRCVVVVYVVTVSVLCCRCFVAVVCCFSFFFVFFVLVAVLRLLHCRCFVAVVVVAV